MSTLGRDADERWRLARRGQPTDVVVLPAIAGVCLQQNDQFIYCSLDEAMRVADELKTLAQGNKHAAGKEPQSAAVSVVRFGRVGGGLAWTAGHPSYRKREL